MPYSGSEDVSLPENVKKLNIQQRRKWVATFNNTIESCQKNGGKAEKCEELAFRIANGTVKKEAGAMEEAILEKGGEGSGNFGHEGRPGEIGGSGEGGGGGGGEGNAHDPTEGGKYKWSEKQGETYEGRNYGTATTDKYKIDKAGLVMEVSPGGFTNDFQVITVSKSDSDWHSVRLSQLNDDGSVYRRAVSDYGYNSKEQRWRYGAALPKDFSELAFKHGLPRVTKESKTEIKEEKIADKKDVICETGATTFEEVEIIEAAREKTEAMQETATIAEGLMGNVLRSQDIPPEEKPGRLQRVIDGLVKRLGLVSAEKSVTKTGDNGQKDNLRQRPGRVKGSSTFIITKDKAGNMHWLGIPTNKWRDRDTPPQIIEEKAHLEFANYLNKTKDFPILLSWHTPGTRIGIADWVDYSNGFLMMGGTIDKDKYNEAEKLREKCLTEDIGMSHGFVYSYSDKEKEIIGKYRTWEVSHLPASNAANVWTSFDILKKEGKTVLNPEKRKYLVELHGEDIVSGLERKAAELEKDLTSAGIDFKEFSIPDTKEVVAQATKSVIESDGFKALVLSVTSLAEKVKTLSETAIPAMQKSIDDVKKVATEAETKAKKSVDDIIAEAMTAKFTAFQASRDGKTLTEEEKKKDQTHEIKVIEPSMAQGFLGKKVVK